VLVAKVFARSVGRLFRPETSMAVGGICYYGLLAMAPLLLLVAVVYGFVFEPEVANQHLRALSRMTPAMVQTFFADQLSRVAAASPQTLSFQGALALLVSIYAASRGTKAVVLGLTVMRRETHAWSFWGYNALGVAFTLAVVAASVIAGLSAAAGSLGGVDIAGASYVMRFVIGHRWMVAGLIFALVAMLLYRYVMAKTLVPWIWSGLGGVGAGLLWAVGSSAFAQFQAQATAELGEIYGSLSAVMGFLLWLYLTATAVLWGGALATEAEAAHKTLKTDVWHDRDEEPSEPREPPEPAAYRSMD
jgi:membrane protein